jgi:Rrf2 family protein
MSAKRINSSMQLTRAADYALRVMIHLAGRPERERALLPQLAEMTGAPESFLSKVLQALTRAHLVASRRGKSGGFVILPRGRQASVSDVVEAIDGPIRLNICLTTGRSCVRKAICPVHPVWVQAQQAMMDVLCAARIADLAARSASEEQEPCAPLALAAKH